MSIEAWISFILLSCSSRIGRRGPDHITTLAPSRLGREGYLWIGKEVTVGGARLKMTGPCPRCVMTILPQYGLPKDPGILRTAAKYNQAHVGVYAAVVQSGLVSLGDVLKIA